MASKGKEAEKGKSPDFVIRARQGPGSDFYITLGAIWRTEVNGEEAFSIKFNALPVNWDGSALAMTPKAD